MPNPGPSIFPKSVGQVSEQASGLNKFEPSSSEILGARKKVISRKSETGRILEDHEGNFKLCSTKMSPKVYHSSAMKQGKFSDYSRVPKPNYLEGDESIENESERSLQTVNDWAMFAKKPLTSEKIFPMRNPVDYVFIPPSVKNSSVKTRKRVGANSKVEMPLTLGSTPPPRVLSGTLKSGEIVRFSSPTDDSDTLQERSPVLDRAKLDFSAFLQKKSNSAPPSMIAPAEFSLDDTDQFPSQRCDAVSVEAQGCSEVCESGVVLREKKLDLDRNPLDRALSADESKDNVYARSSLRIAVSGTSTSPTASWNSRNVSVEVDRSVIVNVEPVDSLERETSELGTSSICSNFMLFVSNIRQRIRSRIVSWYLAARNLWNRCERR